MMNFKFITDDEIRKESAWANFGSRDPVAMIKEGLLKVCCGWGEGHSVKSILKDLGLLTPAPHFNITKKGRRQLWEWYKIELTVANKEKEQLREAIECLEQMIIIDNQSPSAQWLVDWCRETLSGEG